ncbi:MAG: pilus assembly protein PilM [Dehalococcoidia bacterium]
MVTLDIEDTSIKMLVVKGKQVEAVASLPLEPGLVRDGVVIDTATVSQRLTELLSAHGISEKKVVVSISGIHSIYRVVNLPQLPKGLLDDAARQEMERVMPVPLNELYTSWQAIPISDMETAMCIVGLPRNTVDAMLDTLNQAGLKPEAMDVKPLALARVADEKDAIIINVQPVGFDIVVMIDGVPELLRSLPFPASAASVPDKISEVKEELEKTVAFHNSSHTENPITQHTAAFVSGELGDTLAGTLEYQVKPLPQLLSYTDSLNTSEYATNIGLALKLMRADISQTRVNINVTPEAYLPKPIPIIQIVSWAFIPIAIAVLLLLGISTLQAARQTQLLQAKVNSAQTQVQIRQGTEAALQQLQTEVDEAKKARDAFKPPLDSARAQRLKVNGDLSKVTSLLPGIVKLTSISYSQSLIINGTAPDDTTIVNYVRDLTDSGQFSEVLISDMLEIEFNEWQFSLTLK